MMHRFPSLVVGAVLLLAPSCRPAFAQDVPLTIKGGEVKVVKVDQVTVVQVDKTVVTKLPFEIVAPPDEGFYDWILPPGMVGVDQVESFKVTSATKGDQTVRVKIRSAVLDGGKIKYLTRFGTYSFAIGDVGPQPLPPIPTPTPDPPPPAPNPIPLPGKRAIIIYKDLGNGRTSLSDKQEDAVYGATLTKYLTDRCTKVEGTPEFRIWPDTIPLKNASEVWRQVMGRTRTSPNWIVLSNGKTGTEEPLPDDETAILNLAKKYLD